MTALTPKDLLALWHTGLRPESSVAWDTETSGLFPDDGARMSVTSVAWTDTEGEWLDFANTNKAMTWAIEEIAPEYYVPIVSVAWPFDQGVVGKPEDNGQGTLWPDAENLGPDQWAALNEWLIRTGEENGLDAHNALFDLCIMHAGSRVHKGLEVDLIDYVVWDTQNVNHLLWPLERTSLKPTSSRLFGQEMTDESKLVQAYLKKAKLPTGRWDLIPWDIVGPYADKDARLTTMLKLRQQWEIRNGKAGHWLGDLDAILEKIDRRLRTMKLLTRMEWRGLPYDEVGSRLAAEQCMARAKALGKELPFEPTTVKAKEFFFGDGKTSRGAECLGLPAYATTEKGGISMTAEILDRMVNDKVPFAKEYAEYAKVVNAASMWYTAYADAMGTDGRLRTRYRQNGTTSTRFSVERVNLQAIPQDYRLSSHTVLDGIPTPRALIADAIPEGWRMWGLDLAQAELRVGAMFAGCTKMLEMIEAGEDLHAFTTHALFQIGEDDPNWFKMRQVGKRGNFSLGFGSGGPTFNKMIRKETGMDLGEATADRIVRDWNRLYPEFSKAIDKHMDVVTRRQLKHGFGWIDLLNKERRWFERFEDTHKAFNQRVQGNLAQFGIDWMLMSDDYLRGCGLDVEQAGLLLTIHDSQEILVPDTEEGEMMARTCADFGRHLWKMTFPDVPGDVDMKSWGTK